MAKEASYAAVLLLMYVTAISGTVVIIQPVNKTIFAFEGSDVIFRCRHPSSESVEWHRSGMRILNTTTFDPQQQRFSIQTDDDRVPADGDVVISRLTVSSISRTEGGSYRCSNADHAKALLEDGESDEVIVQIIKVGAAINITGPANNTVTQGEDLLLICSGDISADLVWYFNGDVLSVDPYGNVIITPEENTETGRARLALTRSQARADHEGQYTCYDQLNRKQGSISIKVVEAGKVVIMQPVNKTITVLEGSDVTFICQHPSTETVEWFTSGLRISNVTFDSKRFSIRADGPTTSLLAISNISQAESGTFKCSNANIQKALFGKGQTDVVDVRVIKVNAAVHIEGPANGVVTQGHDLHLICTGDITSELIWYFKGNLLQPDLSAQLVVTPEENRDMERRSSSLTQSKVTADHEGIYHCYDEVNKKHASINIKVALSDGSIKVHYSSALQTTTFFTAAIALALSV